MSGNVDYKPTSIEEVQKNWIELLLDLFSKETVQDDLQTAFEKKYGIKLPEGMLQRYARELEGAKLITYGDGMNPTTEKIESCYRLTLTGSNRLDYLCRIRGGEVMKMKQHRTIYTLKKRESASVRRSVLPKFTSQHAEALVQSVAEKSEKKENSKLPTEHELELVEEYRMEVPLVLEMTTESEINGNELKSRVDSELGYTSQNQRFFALLQMLETVDAIRRVRDAEFKHDLGKSKYRVTIKGGLLLSYLTINKNHR